MLTPERRATIARIGGLAASAMTDGLARTAKARSTYRESFQDGHGCSRCPTISIPTDITPEERDRRANALWKAHFARLGRA